MHTDVCINMRVSIQVQEKEDKKTERQKITQTKKDT
jgi:hypothetical protein